MKSKCESIDSRFPKRVSINITRKCNLRCKHCFSSSGKADQDELTTKELFGLIDQLKEVGKPTLAIGGGEPLKRGDLFEVIAYARKNDIPVSIVTNGTLVNGKIAQKFNNLKLTDITVSIDGLKNNHNLIRGKGNFERAIKGIKILREYVITARLSMRVIVNATNIKDYLKLIKLAEILKLDTIRFTSVLPMGKTIENQYLLLNQKQYLQFLKDCHKVKAKIEVVLPDKKTNSKMLKSEGFGCLCEREICWITQTGEVYPCIFLGDGYLVGNIKKERFFDLWERSREIARFKGNEYCNNCENYKNCGGGCRCRAL